MAEGGKPPDMGDLLAYFEERSRSLDAEGQPCLEASTLQFISLIRFDGVSILPPVLTQERRQEMQTYKREALRLQNQNKAKKRDELHAKVQSIVAGVEERRAARQAAKSSSSPASKSGKKQSSKMETVSKITTKSAMTEKGTKAPHEIIINVSASQSQSVPTKSSKSSVSSTASSPNTSRRSAQASPSGSKASSSSPKPAHKYSNLSKQKSFSSQHLDRTPSRIGKDGSESPGSGKSLSPNSGGLLPHPPQGKPLRRSSQMRQSSSTPDLRTIDFTVETDQLKQPLLSKNLAVKGGRPQAPEKDLDTTVSKKESKTQESSSKVQSKQTVMKARPETAKTQSNVTKDRHSKKTDATMNRLSENTSGVKSSTSRTSRSKSTPPIVQIQNPLEVLEKEISKEEDAERSRKFDSIRPELDPVQTAAAELFPFPISEEQALATLDSLHSDFASMEQADSLPGDYNGIPLTSMKQKQIIHMLTKLSKALNIEDTLTSTTSSSAGGDHVKDIRYDLDRSQSAGYNSVENRSVPNGASGREYSVNDTSETFNRTADDSGSMTNDSNTTAQSSSSMQNTSASSISNHSRARMSPTGSSSILSSASSVSGSRARMSPKSLRNTTVHFSSFVTEISTSASQSYEDKISYRKMDITPKSSENFEAEGGEENTTSSQSGGRKDYSEQTGDLSSLDPPNSMLSKVVLSPSVDSSTGSPGEIRNNPFETSSQDGELNTSDKENEFVPPVTRTDENYRSDMSGGRPSSRNQHVLNVYRANIPEGPIGPYHPAVGKSSLKTHISDQDSLKSDHAKLSTQEDLSRHMMDTNYSYGNASSSIAKFLEETKAGNSCTSSFQEEITRSYLHENAGKLPLLHVEDDYQDRLRDRDELFEKQLDDMQSAHILLTPVIDSNLPRSLEQNRSMLEEEDKIRSNLDRVYLEDDEDETESEQDIQVDVQEEHSDEENVNREDKNESDDESVVNADNTSDDGNMGHDKDEHDHDNHDAHSEENNGEKCEVVSEVPEVIHHDEVEEEEKGKADHIQKYLDQVHEQSMQKEDDYQDEEKDVAKSNSEVDVMSSIGDVIQSFTSTIQSMQHLSQDELLRIQAEQFEELQKRLIEQQRAQLEELFVAQRREQMNLQQEIESYQHQIQGQDTVETMQLTDTIRPQISASLPQVTQAWQYQNTNVAMTPPFPLQPVASTGRYYNNLNASGVSCDSYTGRVPYPNPTPVEMPGFTSQYQVMRSQGMPASGYAVPYQNQSSGMPRFDPRYVNIAGEAPRYPGPVHDPDLSHISHNTSYSTIPHQEPVMPPPDIQKKDWKARPKSQPINSNGPSNPYIYPLSPSLCMNPKDQDNTSDVSGFAKATPKQLIFSNQSTPVAKTFKPVMHSPVKRMNAEKSSGRMTIPPEVFDPAMQERFAKVSATVKGYLTRRLLKTQKVQEIIKTIDETRNVAFSFQAETPIKNGTFTREDRGLLERIVAQLQAALLDIHEIFFNLPVSERMNLIALSRQTEQQLRMRESQRSSFGTMTHSQPKISKATLKAMERKKKAQIAEESVFGSMEFRPKSAPPNTSSPHLSTDIRALRPLQGHVSPISADNQVIVREMKERPKTARDKTKAGTTTNKPKKTSSGNKSARTSNPTASTKQQKATTNKPKKTERKTEKAWR